jgi:hypothetical protein
MPKLPDFRDGRPRRKRAPERKGPPPEGLLTYLARMGDAETQHRGEGEDRERRFLRMAQQAVDQNNASAAHEAEMAREAARQRWGRSEFDVNQGDIEEEEAAPYAPPAPPPAPPPAAAPAAPAPPPFRGASGISPVDQQIQAQGMTRRQLSERELRGIRDALRRGNLDEAPIFNPLQAYPFRGDRNIPPEQRARDNGFVDWLLGYDPKNQVTRRQIIDDVNRQLGESDDALAPE